MNKDNMNKDDMNWLAVEAFFGSTAWDNLIEEAVTDENPDAKSLMDDILLRFQSAIFRVEIGDLLRFNKEVSELSTITNYVNKVYEQ